MAWFKRVGTVGAVLGGVAALGATSAFAAPVDVAIYHMAERGGTLVDSAGYDNNGVLQDVTTGVPGKVGLAYKFNGTSSVAIVPDSPNLDPGSANITYSAWIKLDKQSRRVDMDVLRKGTDATAGGDYKLDLWGKPTAVKARCELDDTRGNQLRATGGRTLTTACGTSSSASASARPCASTWTAGGSRA